MNDRIEKQELIERISQRTRKEPSLVQDIVDATLEEIYEALKRDECVSLRNFGTFFIRRTHEGRMFRFNPSQRFRKLFGWASTYKGKV